MTAVVADAALSIAGMRRRLAAQFRQAGIDTPELDARVLLGHALALDHAALVAQSERNLTQPETDAIAALARRRLAREPVARIVGTKEFWGLRLALNAETLVPRPETETVVEAALQVLGPSRTRRLRIADLGTGSGALLLALLTECSAAYGVGTDVSATALGCARANAVSLGVATRAGFINCDYGAALGGGLDLIVANPPYVARDDIPALAPEVRMFDPLRALDGGPDGASAYRAIAGDARRLLAPGGMLVLEFGADQLGTVTAIMVAAGLVPIGTPHNDLARIPRALAVKLSP
jgi:release factor glutamine methyltransferase